MTKDPYRYFRIEAQELLEGLNGGFAELEDSGSPDLIRQLLRQAHTLKGAARVVRQTGIAELSHQLEDLLSPYRELSGAVERRVLDRAFEILDQVRVLMAALGSEAQPAEITEVPARKAPGEDAPSTIRIGIGEMDALIGDISEALVGTAFLKRDAELIDSALREGRALLRELEKQRHWKTSQQAVSQTEGMLSLLGRARKAIRDHSEQISMRLSDLRNATSELRLVSAGILLTELERSTRDAARSVGKSVRFRGVGAETRIDAYVLSRLRGALRHLVRNAVAHGIEGEVARANLGKPAAGTVEISIERRGHRIEITCRDDGRGIDFDAVRRAAVGRGLLSEPEARELAAPELIEMLLRGGLSTTETVTDVSGRGVGLDVVRETVEALNGDMAVESRPDEGTAVELRVPISLASMPALALEVDGSTAMVPLDSVRQALRFREDEISRSADGESIAVNGNLVPFVSLRRTLQLPDRAGGGRAVQSAVVVEAAGQLAAVGADRIGGVENIVVRNLPDHIGHEGAVAGVTLDQEGAPQIVLAPGALVEAASKAGPEPEMPRRESRPPLLVIDDSLTTRMLEQSILESAGYAVDLAVSGEEALGKAKQQRYGLFIVDVEMPGMNGFDFIAHARTDPDLRDVPAILVTSRASIEDKRRGKEVGARAYIVKSSFDQRELLETIRRLVD